MSSETQPTTASPATASQNAPAFVNEGERVWKETRKAWVKPIDKNAVKEDPQQDMDVDIDYRHFVTSESFPQPVPLKDLVRCLIDFWEMEEYE